MESTNMIKLMIESRLENISLVGGAVRGIADMLSIDPVNCYQLELCVVEAVTNVTKHAYHSQTGHWVEVDILIYPDRLTFKICDRGESMNLSKVVPLDFDPLKVESLPEHGMGVFILKNLMDEIRYEVVNGQNILTMSKFLTIKHHPA